MSGLLILLIAFAVATAASAILITVTSDIVRAVFLLFGVLLGVAALFVFSGSDFVAAAQIVVYAGGILIVILFGVMLSHKARSAQPVTGTHLLVPAAAICILIFPLLLQMTGEWETAVAHPAVPQTPMTAPIGKVLLTDALLPFEAVSVLLLLALAGAVMISSPRQEEAS